jgi:hypothetical protein
MELDGIHEFKPGQPVLHGQDFVPCLPASLDISCVCQAPRKQLASKAARKSAPSTGGVKKPHRFRYHVSKHNAGKYLLC